MKTQIKPTIRSSSQACHFVQFTKDQVKQALVEIAKEACGIADGVELRIQTTDIDGINLSITHDLPHAQNSAKEAQGVAESVAATREAERIESAFSGAAVAQEGAVCAKEARSYAAAELKKEVEAAQELVKGWSPVEAHVRSIPADSLWGLENDIELLERSIEGQNHHQIGDAMGWAETAILKRFCILVGRKGKEPAKFGREEVLDALRELRGTAKQEAAE